MHAAGLDTSSRSHFDNQAQIELGTPGDGGTTDGWLTRHFLTRPGLPADTPDGAADRGLVDHPERLARRHQRRRLRQPRRLSLQHRPVGLARRPEVVAAQYPRSARDVDPRYAQGLVSLDASGFIEQNVPTLSSYVPANGAVYPAGSFGDSLKLTAQLIKLDMGLRAATLDLGGWDTHNGQGTAADGQFFWDKIAGALAGARRLLHRSRRRRRECLRRVARRSP